MTIENGVAIFLGIVANIATIPLVKAASGFKNWASKSDPRRSSYFLLGAIILWVLCNIGLLIYVICNKQSLFWLLAAPISMTIILIYSWHQLNQFWTLGIRGVDNSVDKGIDYKKSLEMCRNEFRFLGTGAGKLRKEPEFEKALIRCQQHPIKFLLCNPQNQSLVNGAKRFGRGSDAYQNIVVDTLKQLADLRNRNSLPIEVRFYPGDPLFRMLFVDSEICLFSYTVLGEGDGSQVPQVHLVKPSGGKREVQSFYYAFDLYFDELWDRSTVWDFKQYI